MNWFTSMIYDSLTAMHDRNNWDIIYIMKKVITMN